MNVACGNICWNADDVYLALIGGCLIGIATSIHYLLMGRVTGFSGIYYSLITFDKGSWNWKLGLMSSVMLASCIMFKIYDNGYNVKLMDIIEQNHYYPEHLRHIILKQC